MRVRFVVMAAVAAFVSVPVARADMIEIKDRGILNGKILSQDGNEVRFEDTEKNLIVVSKKDVLFLEAQADAPPAAKGPNLLRWRYKAERFFKDAKRFFKEKTRTARDVVNAPLDRSAADSRSTALADSMGELSTNLQSLHKQDKKRMNNLRIASEGSVAPRKANVRDAQAEAMRSGTYSKDSKDSGKFSSLD